jgi:geranylgeranyl diphosphate synthase type I
VITGKPAGDDLLTGKPTALLMLAHQLATPAQRAELLPDPAGAVIPADGSGGLNSPAALARRAEVIAETGAVARVEALIQQRVADGIEALAGAPIHEEARTALTNLATSASHRRA